jgi:hypothetical protein
MNLGTKTLVGGGVITIVLSAIILAVPSGKACGCEPEINPLAPSETSNSSDVAPRVTSYDGSFDDATFALENAIIDRGLKVDHISHIGEMLIRTGKDLGRDKTIFSAADMYLFCSAVLSREMMEADPMNIAHCPYGVFVADLGDDAVVIGHRAYPDGVMQKVETLLADIVAEAVAN